MKLYYVELKAIYYHGVLSIWTDLAKAKTHAETIANTPNDNNTIYHIGDGHHDFEVIEIELDRGKDGTIVATYNKNIGWFP